MNIQSQGGADTLRLSGITKRFGPLLANDGIGFEVGPGEVVSLLGENGAGKTTLMNILFGHYVADEGEIEYAGVQLGKGNPNDAISAGIGMVHQHFALVENMSIAENVVLGTESLFSPRTGKKQAERKIAELLEEIGLSAGPDEKVADLSVGEKQRVEIVKALYRDSRVLIMDEPTAVLTPFEVESLFAIFRRLVRRGLSVVFISHKLSEAMSISDRILVLRKGRLVGERTPDSTDSAELAALMVGEPVTLPEADATAPGSILLELQTVSTASETARVNLADVTLSLRAGEITGIAGVAGNGQSLLASILSGTMHPAAGKILVDGVEPAQWSPRTALALGIARIPEDRLATGMFGDMSIVENMVSEQYRSNRFNRSGFVRRTSARRFAEQIISEYDVKCPSPFAPARLLSGGNMQKLILGRALDQDPRIVIANQPTRGLDVGAVAYVHGRLLAARERGAAVLLISDELEEILSLSDKVAVMSDGRLTPAMDRGQIGIKELGRLMARGSRDHSEAAHAA